MCLTQRFTSFWRSLNTTKAITKLNDTKRLSKSCSCCIKNEHTDKNLNLIFHLQIEKSLWKQTRWLPILTKDWQSMITSSVLSFLDVFDDDEVETSLPKSRKPRNRLCVLFHCCLSLSLSLNAAKKQSIAIEKRLKMRRSCWRTKFLTRKWQEAMKTWFFERLKRQTD